MKCPSCGALVSTELRVCEHCGRDLRALPRPLAGRPSRFQVDESGHRLEIRWRWFTPTMFFLLFFAIGWNTFLVFWYGIALSMPGEFGLMRYFFMLFPIVHVAVGLGLIYGVATGFVNSTAILVERGELSVTHGPIYYPGSLRIDVSDVDQVYVVESRQQGKHGETVTGSVKLRTRDNRELTLVDQLPNLSDGIYLEQTIEDFLRIRDERVAGEIDHGVR